jgi:hypothetical protein
VNNGAADPDGEIDDDELAEWCDDIHEMEIAITALAPVTLTGLAAKAAFVRKTLDVAGAELSDPECHHARLESSLYETSGSELPMFVVEGCFQVARGGTPGR